MSASELGPIVTDRMVLNIGPAHPISHGTLRIQVELEGERILRSACEIGYLHRGFEKEAEQATYQQVIPYTERLNYMSPVHNSSAWCHACELLLGIEAPPRAQAIRVITSEMSRIIDHAVCIGANLVDLGALTNFWYLYGYRERIYTLFEELCGARMMVNYPRIGGVPMDLPEGWLQKLDRTMDELSEVISDVKGLVANNRIFLDRTRGVGAIDAEKALSFGWTGPCLRACGVDRDLRRDAPYWGYERYDFDVPLLHGGDTCDRVLIRFDEMEQSRRLIRQAVEKLPGGPVMADEVLAVLPPKDRVYNTMEGLIHHFKLVMHGLRPPPGEVYSATEAPNGELGYYIVSDGGPVPWRVRIRPPCFANYSAMPELINGGMVSDVAATLGSLNIIAGELDR